MGDVCRYTKVREKRSSEDVKDVGFLLSEPFNLGRNQKRNHFTIQVGFVSAAAKEI